MRPSLRHAANNHVHGLFSNRWGCSSRFAPATRLHLARRAAFTSRYVRMASSMILLACRSFSLAAAACRLRPTPNPLAHHFQKPPEQYPDWRALYSDPCLPFHIDLGCGKGHVVHKLAREHPEMNFLGLELQEDRVKSFERLPNLAFFRCNVNVALVPLLKSFIDQRIRDGQAMRVRRFTMLYPDPWFKKRHHKRRMMTAELARTIHQALTDDEAVNGDSNTRGEMYLESDFAEGFLEARDTLLQSGFELQEHLSIPHRFGKTEFAERILATSPTSTIFAATFHRTNRSPEREETMWTS